MSIGSDCEGAKALFLGVKPDLTAAGLHVLLHYAFPPGVTAFAPGKRLVSFGWQRHRQGLHRNRFVTGLPTQPCRPYAVTGPGLAYSSG
jgi:hypothetical protein